MRKILRKRKATTLIELVVVLVMMGLFIMMVFNMFSVTFDAYTFNREMAAKMYAQTNVDCAFEIIERELMYSKSLGNIMATSTFDAKTIYNATPLIIEASTITTKYALAEQLILTKKDKERYNDIDKSDLKIEFATELTYFPLYRASIPNFESETNWTVAYDDINDTMFSTVLNITVSTDTATITTNNTLRTFFRIAATDTSNSEVSTPATYVSPLLYEKAIELEKPIQLFDELNIGRIWNGEMVYNSTIHLKYPETTDETTKLVLKKGIPSITREYEITLIDNIIDFDVTETSEMYNMTLSYLVPGTFKGVYKKGNEQASITVSRKILKPF